MSQLGDGLRDVAYAGIGLAAFGAEAFGKVATTLVDKGAQAVANGKAANEELKHKVDAATGGAASKVAGAAQGFSDEALDAILRAMSPEQRESFAERVAATNAKIAEDVVQVEAEVVEDATDDAVAAAAAKTGDADKPASDEAAASTQATPASNANA